VSGSREEATMPVRTSSAHWDGPVPEGHGQMRLGSGAFEGSYGFGSRMGDEAGTNPEELIGAAHAGCFSMALAAALTRSGHPPTSIDTTARVRFEQRDGVWTIVRIDLSTQGTVPGIDAEAFRRQADEAKRTCPVSRALAGVDIELDARLNDTA
jgi:lipoyl-dependent peroxiredoxin